MKPNSKIVDFNIFYGSILFSMLVAEMVSGQLFNFYVIRFLQLFIIINLFFGGIRVFSKFWIFLIPSFIYVIFSIPYFENKDISGDFFNIFWWVIFMLIINFSIRDNDKFQKFVNILIYSTFFIVSVLAIIGLVKLYLSTKGIIFPQLMVLREDGNEYPLLGSSLSKDYNIYSFGVFCGVFAGLYCYRNTTRVYLKMLYSLLILSSLLSAVLSMSRRGLVLGILLLLFVIIWSFFKNSWDSNKIEFTQSKKLRLPWVFFITIPIIALLSFKVDWSSFLFDSNDLSTLLSRIDTISTIGSAENDTRGSRWIFSFEYFSNLNIFQKIMGNGFDYMSTFGKEFQEADMDHPHNVWISSLLYGGILGFLSTSGLTIAVLIEYFRRRDMFKALFYWYILFLILNFTSSNTIFSSRVFVVLLLIPFLDFFKQLPIKSSKNLDKSLI